MTTQLSRRLTSHDASFLYLEKPKNPMHVGTCNLYEGRLTRDDVIRLLAGRIHLLPRYRQKVVFPPLPIAHPTWEDDPSFDIANHVEEVELPAPGDDQVLSEFGGKLFAPQLDRDRPLWKLIVMRGREDGNTPVMWKIHHAMVDGISGIEITMVMHDLKADAAPPAAAAMPQARPLPDSLALLEEAVRDRLTDGVRWWTEETFRLFRPSEMAGRFMRMARSFTSPTARGLAQPAPSTPFNGPLSGEIQFAWAALPMRDVRKVRAALGGTVNDVVLAVVSGGLGHYLRHHGVATDGLELRAMCPVSMRKPDERGALGNLVSAMIVPLYVGITDPVARLDAERQVMERLKGEDQAGMLFEAMGFANRIPPAVQVLSSKLEMTNRVINTVSTNVPGPQVPLYLAGHKLIGFYPVPPCAGEIGLMNAIISYDQNLTIGVSVDPKRVPDPWFYADSLHQAFAELLQAARQAEGEKHVA